MTEKKMKGKRFPAAVLGIALAASLAVISPAAVPVPVSALENGVYTAPANTYYLNPDTGVTDDGGSRDPELDVSCSISASS